MRSIRYWIRIISSFISRFKGILFIGLISGVLIFIFFTLLYPRLFLQKTEYIGLAGRYQTDTLPREILSLIGEGLTSINEEGTAVPGLAESWESTEQGRVWTFKLKQNLQWQDGTPVTSENIQYSFEDVEIERPDESTIVFMLDNIFSPFPVVVSQPTFKRGLLGTGEWEVKKIDLSGTFVSQLDLVNKNGDRKIYRMFPTEDQAKTAFKLGEIDQLIDMLEPEPINEWSMVTVDEDIRYGRFVGLFLNNENPVLGGVDAKPLRQALSYAIDKNSFGLPRAKSPISSQSWAYNPQVKDYAYDQERAKELFDNGVPDEMKENIEIKLATIPALLDVAEKIAKDWEAIGVKTVVQVTPGLPTEYEAFLAIYDIPPDPDQYSTWHSLQVGATNISKYSNPRIDTLLEAGRQELNVDERRRIYLDFQRFLLEDAPAIFLYHPVSYTINRK